MAVNKSQHANHTVFKTWRGVPTKLVSFYDFATPRILIRDNRWKFWAFRNKIKQKSKIINYQTFHQTQFKLLMCLRHFFFLFIFFCFIVTDYNKKKIFLIMAEKEV